MHKKELGKICSNKTWISLTKLAKNVSEGKSLRCPSCNFDMKVVSIRSDKDILEINFCVPCDLIWFNKDEIEELKSYDKSVNNIKSLPLEFLKSHTNSQSEIIEKARIKLLLSSFEINKYESNQNIKDKEKINSWVMMIEGFFSFLKNLH